MVQIDHSQEEESTWVEDPVKEMTNQLAAVRAEKARQSSELGQDARKLVELRQTLDDKLMLSAELDSFCASFFPTSQKSLCPGCRVRKDRAPAGQRRLARDRKRLRGGRVDSTSDKIWSAWPPPPRV